MDQPGSAESKPTNLADAINRICTATIVEQLTPSQSKPGPAGFKCSALTKAKSPFKPQSTTSEPIDLTHSDDEYERGDRFVMQKQLDQFPWQKYGLTPDIIAPGLQAIKGMEGEYKALFSDDVNVKEIFQLGLRALKNKQAVQGESSVASD